MASQPPAYPDLSHRHLLANIDDHYHLDSSDNDMTTDDEMHVQGTEDDTVRADCLVGISISRTQSRMRSPRTPAVVKSQALETLPKQGCFVSEPETIEHADTSQDDLYHSNSTTSEGAVLASSSGQKVALPSQSQSGLRRQSSLSKVRRGQKEPEGRKRSSSATSKFWGNLVQRLPGVSPSSPRKSSLISDSDRSVSDNVQKRCTNPAQPSLNSPYHSATTGSSGEKELVQPEVIPGSLDGSTFLATLEVQDARPQSMRRATSENSLYLRPAITGASSFDDTSTYANIADMPNSRFKAITDSFQETSIKLPKLHGIGITSSRASPNRSDNDIARKNTLTEQGHMKATQATPLKETIPQSDTPSSIPSNTKHPFLKDALSRASGDIVFMGGYRGSILRSAASPHHQVWVPVKVGLNLRKVDLEVGLTHEDEERMEETIIPSGMLSHIGPIDISRRLLKKVRRSPNVRSSQLRVHDYGYDWRLSPHFLSQKLIKFLESLDCNQADCPVEQRGALVVAHSLGGLITRHAVNQRPELFSGVVYAGVPQNCCNILGPLRSGDDVLISSRVLTAQVNFTLRTSYALLPENGRCFLNADTGEAYDVDFFDVKNWDEYRLSPCINPALTQPVARRKSLIGSVTDSISSVTPSLPTKPSSWFSDNGSTSTRGDFKNRARGARDDFKDAAKNTGDDFKDAAKGAGDFFQTSVDAGQSLEPSMGTNTNKSSVATTVTIPREKAYEYLERTLSEVKLFKQQLNHSPSLQERNAYPPQAILFGKSMPTVYGAKVSSREAIKYNGAYDDLAFAAGDGVVLASAAQLPAGYRCVKNGRVESDRGHVGLLGDLEGIGRCISAVVEGRKRGIGMEIGMGKNS